MADRFGYIATFLGASVVNVAEGIPFVKKPIDIHELTHAVESAIETRPVRTLSPRVDEMMQRTHRRTVPQIYIGERHVGGYDDLAALDRAGGLDPLLAA